MKILLINNCVILESDNGLFVDNRTGAFVFELSKIIDKLEMLQFIMRFETCPQMADYRIDDKHINITGIRRGKHQIVPFIRAFMHGYKKIKKTDFVYLFFPGNICIIFGLLALFHKKPYGIYVRGEKGISSPIAKFLYKHGKVVLTISPIFTQLIKRYRANAETIRPMIGYSEKDIVEDRKYIKKNIYTLLYIGRLELNKGSFDIIWAVKRMLELGISNFVFDLVGDGPDIYKLKKLVKELELTNTINIYGSVTGKSELAQFYLQSDLFVFPSHNEGFPRVIYEAAIMGLPIATTFVGTIAYLMKDKYNCIRLPMKNPNGMAECLIKALNNYDDIQEIANNATITIKEYFSTLTEFPHEKQLIRLIRAC